MIDLEIWQETTTGAAFFAAPVALFPGGEAVFKAASPRSKKLHREALTPTQLTQKLRSASLYASTQEGG